MDRARLSLAATCWLLLSVLPAHLIAFELNTRTLTINGERWPLSVPAGTDIRLVNDQLSGPRLLTFLPNDDLLVGSRSGNVYRLPPPYETAQVLINLPDYPHSIAYRAGQLLIAQTDGLYAAPYKPGQTRLDWNDVERLAALPVGGSHTSRTVAIGPDRRVYVALGISGNCDDEYLDSGYPFQRQRGGVLVLDETGGKNRLVPFASGLRNPVGMDWHPQTGVLYASNNGPDHLGFDQPPEYFAALTEGSFHGMPWFQYDGKTLRRDECISDSPPRPAKDVSLPDVTFPARNAPMGVAFVPEGALDARFTGNAIVAFKGSWGTRPSGGFFGKRSTRRPPRVMMVRFEAGKPVEAFDIISGFQRPDGERLARLVGVAIGPDGALYFTSDSETEGLFRLSLLPGSR